MYLAIITAWGDCMKRTNLFSVNIFTELIFPQSGLQNNGAHTIVSNVREGNKKIKKKFYFYWFDHNKNCKS